MRLLDENRALFKITSISFLTIKKKWMKSTKKTKTIRIEIDTGLLSHKFIISDTRDVFTFGN